MFVDIHCLSAECLICILRVVTLYLYNIEICLDNVLANKMVIPNNGPAAKLLAPPTLTLVQITVTGHHMVIESTSHEFPRQ